MNNPFREPLGNTFTYPRLFALVVALWSMASLASYAEQRPGEHPKVDSAVFRAARLWRLGGRQVAARYAQQSGLKLAPDGIEVVIEPVRGRKVENADAAAINALGGRVIDRSSRLLLVSVPAGLVRQLADLPFVAYVRPPLVPFAEVVSQGVSLTGASNYHTAGFYGQGAKVAVIDLGFIGLTAAINAGELPSNVIQRDETGSGMQSGTQHGTGVAEVVHDMAPQAQLYLIKIGNEVHLENAKDYCIAQGVRVVNHSVGWVNTNFYDGTGVICDIAEDAYANGILWANAAGNSARRHWQGVFTDTDSNTWHEFAPNDELLDLNASGGSTIAVFLTWNDWPASNNDYDFYLLNSSLQVKASSVGAQTGTQPPTESIWYNVPAGQGGTYYLKVKNYSASGTHTLSIFSFYHDFSPYVSASSLMAPADAVNVMAVAAIYHGNWTTGPQEYFSSQGPANDGRIKPDISGPDGVSNYTYGSAYGTSFSSPHVAGAAALVLSRFPAYTVSQVWSELTSSAIDMGSPGKDNIYGHGRLNLSIATTPTPTLTPTTTHTPTWTATFTDTPTATVTSTSTPSGALSGAITFSARSDFTDRAVIKLKDVSSGTLSEHDVLTDAAGSYLITDIPASTYHILCTVPGYLARLESSIVISSGQTSVVDFLSMTPGDFNADNQVGLTDLTILSGSYGVVGGVLPSVPPSTPTPPSTYGTLQGKITFVVRTNHADRATIHLQDTTTGEIDSYDVLTTSSGDYSVSNVPAGTYNILCHSPCYLRRLISAVVVPEGGVATVDFLDLRSADTNDDNAVTFLDIGTVSAVYGQSGDNLP